MKPVRVRAHQSFVASIGIETVPLSPGMEVVMSETQAREYNRAGYVSIIGAEDAKPVQKQQKRDVIAQTSPPPPPDNEPRDGVAAVIVNYNMPERADALAEYIKAHCKNVDVILVDNGSDQTEPAKNTTLRMAWNVQTTGGWLMGLYYADVLAVTRGKKYKYYWFLITSAAFEGEADPLAPMVELLERDNNAVGVHPALQADCVTAWKHMITRGGDKPRRAWMIDNIASLYRAEWFDSIGRFDKALTYAWGIDLETGYLARKQGRSLWIHEGCKVTKVTNIGYAMNRMGMTAKEREQRAEANMETVLSAKYGPTWRDMLWNDYNDFSDGDLISVILPTYNRRSLLPRALESLKAQTYQNFEAIVVNDAGVDVSDIVARYPFAKYISHDTNKGLSAARNTAIKAAQGRYLAYLDDDDWYYTNHLETAVKAIKKGHRAVYTNAHAIDREYDESKGRYIFQCEYTPDFILKQNVFPCNTVLHERSLIDEVGWFDESLPNSEDWDMWIRINFVTPWHHVPVITCAVDRTRPTMSSDRPAMMRIFEQIRARYARGSGEMIKVIERQYGALDINKTKWEGAHPQGISGCVRVCNDGEFLYPAVVSHLPYLDECVLALQPSTDNTEEICDRLAREYPDKVRVVRYPVNVHYINHPEWETTPEDSAYSFIHLSNWAVAQCRYSWIAKFESDVICLSSFQKIIDRIKAEPHRQIYYGRVILNLAGPELNLFNAKVPCNGGWDEAVYPNNPLWKFIKSGKYETINPFVADHECMGWSALHTKHAKARYWGKINEPFLDLTRDNVKAVMTEYLKTHQWPAKDNPLGEDCLFEDAWRAYLLKPEAVNE